MPTRPLLEQLKESWLNNGWDMKDLNCFRMEMAAGDGAGGDGGEAGGQGFAQSDGSGSEYSQMASGFLGRVPQEHRAILEPYVKQWDAGVTRRFQELQSQVAAYNGYDPDTVSQAMSIAEQIEANPWAVYGTLREALMSGEFGPQPDQQPVGQQYQQAPQQQDQGTLGWQQQMPEEFMNEFNQMRQALVMMGQQMISRNQVAQQQQEQEQLDAYLESLHAEYGDFDDQWVLLQILNDQNYDNVEQHITDWQGKVNSRQGQQQEVLQGLPNLLGTNGGTAPAPLDAASVKNLSRSDTKNLVASVLEQAARAREGHS